MLTQNIKEVTLSTIRLSNKKYKNNYIKNTNGNLNNFSMSLQIIKILGKRADESITQLFERDQKIMLISADLDSVYFHKDERFDSF